MDFFIPVKNFENVIPNVITSEIQTENIIKVPKNRSVISTIKPSDHRWKSLFGVNMSIFTVDNAEYLLGVQIATLLKRETFNLYRSLKIKGVNMVRANPEQVEFLINCQSIKRGTHSVTLIPYEEGLVFISSERKKIDRKVLRKHKQKHNELSSVGKEKNDTHKHKKEKHMKSSFMVVSPNNTTNNNTENISVDNKSEKENTYVCDSSDTTSIDRDSTSEEVAEDSSSNSDKAEINEEKIVLPPITVQDQNFKWADLLLLASAELND